MDPAPCFAKEGDDRWPGTVLAWRRDDRGAWVGLTRFTVWTAEGWPMQYEHALPAARLVPREV